MHTLAAFLNDLEHTRLLTPEEMEHYRQTTQLDPPVTPEELASELVRHGRLSRYQAETLLRGNFRGLNLGDYEILAPLGKGGMAHVFLATSKETEELLAVKLLPPNKAAKMPHLVDRFHREALVGKRLNHPGITRVQFLRYIKGVLCLALEYVPGLDLYRTVQQQSKMEVGPACRLMADAAVALDSAHRSGIVHGDLKPANLMVVPREIRALHHGTRAKLLDFGLAIDLARPPATASLSGKGNIAGTLAYMAPEQTYPDKLPTPASDLYSLGCTLFFALTARTLFAFDGIPLTAQEKIDRHRHAPPPEILDFLPLAPPGLAVLMNQLLAKDPRRRPSSAAVVARTLRELGQGL